MCCLIDWLIDFFHFFITSTKICYGVLNTILTKAGLESIASAFKSNYHTGLYQVAQVEMDLKEDSVIHAGHEYTRAR